ncbi:TIGR02996 domain-containing protein [Micromonospora sp. LOL_023]|uniref:TIGR02996 domain-containing protein n=1 Tax=Micromonospora sp. LOL_023 TaxID=3345418 RepID=UPI003A874C20
MSDASDARPAVSDALYAAILADPDDLGLRLRYADAVEPTDPDHAELIRLQIEPVNAPRLIRLERRVGPRIAAPVAGFVAAWRVNLGFVDSVTMSGSAFVEHGERVLSRAPVRHLVLTDVAGHLPAIAASGLLDRLVGLDLGHNPIGDDGLSVLLGAAALPRLRWLGLAGCGIGPVGAERLAATSALPNLRYVDFRDNLVAVTAFPVGEDIDGSPVHVELPEFGRSLVDRYGPLPWLSLDWGERWLGVGYDEV